MKIAEARRFGRAELNETSGSPALDADIFLTKILNIEKADLITDNVRVLSDSELDRYFSFIQRRKESEPVAYIINEKEFWGLNLFVDERVLIPRPETELLVEYATRYYLANEDFNGQSIKILDLGTGSGCISIALAYEFKKHDQRCQILAADVSKGALEVAKVNAETFDLVDVIAFQESSWFSTIGNHKFDLIISNPPYIAEGDKYVSPELQYEPRQALYSGLLGLDDIEKILLKTESYLLPHGVCIFEHGAGQSDLIKAKFEGLLNKFLRVETVRDHGGYDRFMVCYC